MLKQKIYTQFIQEINMPNWCSNKIIFDISEAKDTDFAQKLILKQMKIPIQDEEMAEGFFSYLVPKEDPATNNSEYYGTKWDVPVPEIVDEDYFEDDNITKIGENKYAWLFDTAWSPPFGFIEKLCEYNPGLKVTLMYCERGCDFIGFWEQQNLEQDSTEYRLTEIVGEYPSAEDYSLEDQFHEAVDEFYDDMHDKMYGFFDEYGLDASGLHTGG